MTTVNTIAALTYSDANILEALRSGEDEKVLNDFVRAHQKFVYSVAFRYLQHKENAQDASQEVFMRAIKALPTFKGESTLQTWLYRITTNVCHSMIRKRKNLHYVPIGEGESELNVPWHGDSPIQSAENSNFNTLFLSILSTLPEKQRETFSLRFFEELSYEEISEMVGTSIGALKANYHWAVKKIASALKKTKYYENWQTKEAGDE